MAEQTIGPTTATIDDGNETRDARGEWTPRTLGKALPFAWPVEPRKLMRFFLGFPGFLWPFGAALFYGLAALTWRYLQPGADDLSNAVRHEDQCIEDCLFALATSVGHR